VSPTDEQLIEWEDHAAKPRVNAQKVLALLGIPGGEEALRLLQPLVDELIQYDHRQAALCKALREERLSHATTYDLFRSTKEKLKDYLRHLIPGVYYDPLFDKIILGPIAVFAVPFMFPIYHFEDEISETENSYISYADPRDINRLVYLGEF
jgi:hypothetical protein